jgi:hypothetical protein
MVWFADQIEAYLWKFVDYLYDAAVSAYDIPIVGAIFGAAIYKCYYYSWYVADYISDFSAWCDGLEDDFNFLDSWIDRLRDAITDLEDLINNLPRLTDIRDYIQGQFTILSYNAVQFVSWLDEALDTAFDVSGLWDWIDRAGVWFKEQFGVAITGVLAMINALGNRLSDIEVTLPDSLEDWFSERFNAMEERVVSWVVVRFEGILDEVFKK